MPSKSSRAKTELKKTSKKTKKKKNKVEPCYQQKTSIGTYNEKTSQKQKKVQSTISANRRKTLVTLVKMSGKCCDNNR